MRKKLIVMSSRPIKALIDLIRAYRPRTKTEVPLILFYHAYKTYTDQYENNIIVHLDFNMCKHRLMDVHVDEQNLK